MRYIKVPEAIDVKHPSSPDAVKHVPFLTFLEEMLNDQRFSMTAKMIDIAYNIQQVLKEWKNNPTPYLVLESAHWDMLVQAVEAPTGGYIPGVGIQMRPFIKAVTTASEIDPEPKVSHLQPA